MDKPHHTETQSDLKRNLRAEIEHAAAKLGITPSTLGERCRQGGQFYARLCADRPRIWPETADRVREAIAKLLAEAGQ